MKTHTQEGLIVGENAEAQRNIPSSDSRDKPQTTAWQEVESEQRLMGIRKEDFPHESSNGGGVLERGGGRGGGGGSELQVT